MSGDVIAQQTEGWEAPTSISLGLDEFATDGTQRTDDDTANGSAP